MTNKVLDQKSKNATTTTTKQKSQLKNPCFTWESNQGTMAQQFNALPLGHRVN